LEKKRTTVELPIDTYYEIEARAKKDDRSIASMIRILLRYALDDTVEIDEE